jgi:REP element-mobilizing transposase RayT
MTEPPLALENDQRQLVEKTISDHCRIRKWTLHAVNCRVCHVHAVVTASLDPDDVRDQFKAWCTRKLKELQGSQGREVRQKWWTEGGSMRRIGDSESLEYVIHYVLDGQ